MSKLGRIGHHLYTGEISYDFVGKRLRWFTASGIVLVIVVIGFFVQGGLNLGIEFTGGAEFQVPAKASPALVNKVEIALNNSGVAAVNDADVTQVGKSTIRVETAALNTEAEVPKVKQTLADVTGAKVDAIAYSLIGASWGGQITQRGIVALVVFLVLVTVLLWIYMRNLKMSAAALIALLHDLAVTIGVYAVVGFSFTPESLIGMLTILGYSLYDTVVVFDKVRENTRNLTSNAQRTYSEAANLAVNQTLVRSINTTVIGVLPVAALLFAGGVVLHTGPLKDLALALFVGMISGAYSSIFIATPLLAMWKEREPDMIRQAKRVASRRAKDAARGRSTVGQPETGTTGSAVATATGRAATTTALAERDDDAAPTLATGSPTSPQVDTNELTGDREVTVGRPTIKLSVHSRSVSTGQADARRDRLNDAAAKRPQPERKPRSERKKSS